MTPSEMDDLLIDTVFAPRDEDAALERALSEVAEESADLVRQERKEEA